MKTLLITCLMLSSICSAANKHEEDYQIPWCQAHDGRWEVVMEDRTRVDCVTPTHAIEFDWAKKWAEAIGQSLGYSMMTGKPAGVVLIAKRERDLKYWAKMNQVIEHYNLPISTWLIREYPPVSP